MQEKKLGLTNIPGQEPSEEKHSPKRTIFSVVLIITGPMVLLASYSGYKEEFQSVCDELNQGP